MTGANHVFSHIMLLTVPIQHTMNTRRLPLTGNRLLLFLLLCLSIVDLQAQSLEIMPGDKRVFADVQWLKGITPNYRWTVFSRTRATVDYDGNTDLFSGAYLNYTTSSGVGLSLVGRIASSGAGADIGPHFFKATKVWTVFALPTISIQQNLQYSWFSIVRFEPVLGKKWKLYSSVELFSAFQSAGHAFSVQRLRLGFTRAGYSFGLANNLSEAGPDLSNLNNNFGVFFRRQFE